MTYVPGGPIPLGWFWNPQGLCAVYNDNHSGWFYAADEWHWRPDLVWAPPAMTWADHVRVEAQRLSTPWPMYSDAWGHAKVEGWLGRRYLQVAPLLIPLLIFQLIVSDPEIRNQPFTGHFIAVIFVALSPLLAFWRVYDRHLGSVDKHKQRAFRVASYAATAAGAHVLAERSERSERPPSSTFRSPGQIGKGIFP